MEGLWKARGMKTRNAVLESIDMFILVGARSWLRRHSVKVPFLIVC
jgi:hypothetical protein